MKELEGLVERIERGEVACRSQRAEIRASVERLMETAKVLRALFKEAQDPEVIQRVFEEVDLVEEILQHVGKLEECEEELHEDIKKLVKLVKEVVLHAKPPTPKEFKQFKREGE